MVAIVELAEAACELIDEREELLKVRDEGSKIAATLAQLTEVKGQSTQLAELWGLLRERIPLKEIYTANISSLLQEVQKAHAKFTDEHEIRQVRLLQDICARLQALLDEIAQRWREYALGLVQNPVNLWAIVQVLPEMQEQKIVINELKEALLQYTSNSPHTSDELGDFDAKLEQLKTQLSGIESVHPEVKMFLYKVHAQKATIADLTDEVLRWCRQENRAEVFQIGL